MEVLTTKRKIELIDILIEKQQAGIKLKESLSNYMCHDIIAALGRKYSSENLKYLIEVFPEFEAFLNKGGKELNSTYRALYTIEDDSLYSEAWAGYLKAGFLSEVGLCEFKIEKLKEFIETLKNQE